MEEMRCNYCGAEWSFEDECICECGMGLCVEDHSRIENKIDNYILDDGYTWDRDCECDEGTEYDYVPINNIDNILEAKRSSTVIIK